MVVKQTSKTGLFWMILDVELLRAFKLLYYEHGYRAFAGSVGVVRLS